MPVLERIRDFAETMQAWRHDLHAHPELLYDVERTAGFVAETSSGPSAATRW